ncbi:MAG: hypothetical protein NT069_22690, partial [Planctomycetota bacterium]|nr:hypothetical protein [Planctomycetota bacterium]
MLAEQIAAGPTAQSPLDERLDAFDRVLIGVDSRSEQRALVGALEARLRSAGGSCAEPLTDFG